MEIVGTNIAISWDYCIPYHYGLYKGKLKDGRICTIDVDWKTKVFTADGEQVGTDQISYWLCDAGNVKSLLYDIEAMRNR